MHPSKIVIALLAVALVQPALGGAGPWPTFVNQTSTRLVASPGLGVSDSEEKDYAWGDVDHDGDIDFVVVRKQPFTTSGARPNVLLMNENGVLTDRTAQYASESSVAGDQGFLTPTNDRDVILTDVNGDGWDDIVTSTTLSGGQPQHISHPRIYINKGAPGGTWLGFRFEAARTPALPQAPNFCGVGAGDITGDGKPELYFVNYNSSLDDRLLVNDGTGFFSDQSALRMTPTMLQSAFGTHGIIADMNGDGRNDIVKNTALGLIRISVSYNNPATPGFFPAANFQTVVSLSSYFVSAGDLNNDGRIDLVVTDDGTDHYHLNQGNGPSGQAIWSGAWLPNSGGIGGNSHIADLNNDGWNDIILCDVDVDIPGCSRQTHIYKNNANPPNVTFTEVFGGIPVSSLIGVYDVGMFDINGDGWKDIVLGRCSETQIWINQPPFAPADLNQDGSVNSLDLGIMLSAWSIPPTAPACGGALPCPADLNHDGFINSLDLGMLLSAWTV